MLDVISACMLAFGAVGLWVCVLSLRSDMFGLGLTRSRAAILAPLFVLVALVAAIHLFREDLGPDADQQAAAAPHP